MRVEVRTAGLSALAAKWKGIAEGLGREWSIGLRLPAEARDPYPTLKPRAKAPGPQPTNADVALANPWLTEVTPTARERVHAALADAWARGIHNGGALMMVAASAWRAIVIARARGEMTDSRPSANTSAWRERKARLGLSTSAGHASGQLARAIESSTATARKVA